MIKLDLWDVINARTPKDRPIADTLKDRDVEPAKPEASAPEQDGKGASPGSTKRRDR
ncbi:hypothetical protein [Mesorhizobium sp. 2RAF21]|uniref:hypothetical protein n=1 Tax=Mesorhizobium sp. 2RAF21 TaxID=3232995 RepID=UPI003F977DCC